MPIKKIKRAYAKRHKLTYKELEWDYLPMIVLFSVVSGILILLFILLTVYNDLVTADKEIESVRNIQNYLYRVEDTPEPTIEYEDDSEM